MYDPSGMYALLEPLGNGCYGFFDDERCCLYVPTLAAPKGSARAIPRTNKATGKVSIAFVPGSGKSTKDKLDTMEKDIRAAVATLWQIGFTPYDSACYLDVDLVFSAPKVRMREERHTTYPDRDKCLRAVQDDISPPRKDRAPVMSSPHLVVNDSFIDGGYCNKWWLHTWNKQTGLQDDGNGIYVSLHY